MTTKLTSALNITIIAALTTLITACDPISGSIQVVKSIRVKTYQNNTNCGHGEMDMCHDTYAIIPTGNMNFSLDFQTSASALLTVQPGGKNITTTLTLPKNKAIPDNGSIALSSREINQPFDLNLNIQTDTSDSEPQWGIESCTYYEREQVCTRDSKGVEHCDMRDVAHSGYQEVNFFNRTIVKSLQGNLSSAGRPQDLIAQLAGRRSDTSKIYLYKTACDRH